MGLHHQSNHGRVFRGLDAKKHLEMQKRDSHGSKVKLNVPSNMKAAARPADPAQTSYAISLANKDVVQTVQSVVYVTLSADFSGSIAGYSTLTDVTATPTDIVQSAALTSTAASTSASVNDAEASYLAAKASASAGASTASGSSTITVSPTSSSVATFTGSSSSLAEGDNNKSVFLNAPTSAVSATSSAAAVTALVGAGVQATHSATTQAQISESNSGMTGGAKAGVAIGVLLAMALAGGLLFFCWRRRRNPNAHQEIHDEKRTSSIFGGKAMAEKHASVGSEHGAPSIRSTHTASTAPRLSLRPVTQFLPSLSNNRKSSATDLAAAAMSEKPKSMWERRANATENPFDDAAVTSEKNPFDEPETHDDSFAHSSHHSQKPSWEGSEPATPKSAIMGTATAVPVTTNSVPAVPQGPNNVHRVQLDFKPSMEDELELKSGQLVRMLHEYDDGWALCIRMDRSQQGVTPRTCLSKLPVKPRPQGPPSNGTNSRPMTPTGPPGMMPRPLTPNGRERSDSNAGVERPTTPTGTIPTRKPVPGQAM
ncbi:hypothetical protein LTR36_010845 [Oleoguttula mirabilis]|uniref:SH3 domain-containing protein n=1 Tax=Oleoguttula mirabilis TaxID=1507867 RepID=A0AAV9J3V6_9PEZI|nr:hypothetical protein LTR36_010845 [Oleoguttula mirabilis]